MNPVITRTGCVNTLSMFIVVLSYQSFGFANDIDRLIESSCLDCHDAYTDTGLDLSSLDQEFEDPDNFRTWVRLYDRVLNGEMPPPSEPLPDETIRSAALQLLEEELSQVNRTRQQTVGRTPTRRLTRLEYQHTLRDLLGIGGKVAKQLPVEDAPGSYDVVAASQEISSYHVRGMLQAANLALEEAIQLGPDPRRGLRELDYLHSRYIQMWIDRPIRMGGSTVFKTDTDVISFRGENFVFRSDNNGFRPPVAGIYRIAIRAAAYQQRSSITLSLKRQNDEQGESEMLAAWDLVGEDYRDVSLDVYLRPDDYIYVSADELEPAPNGAIIYSTEDAESFEGEGVKIRRVTIEGPIEANWPPDRTITLFPGIEWKAKSGTRRGQAFEPILTQDPSQHMRDVVASFARSTFQRELTEQEIDQYVDLVDFESVNHENFTDAAKIPLRAMLIAPELVFLAGTAGELDDDALARRLSYFLWRSVPDQELLQLASSGRLSEPEVLSAQVIRMLDDKKSTRFVVEFLDQWLDLDRIDATTPDPYLYPEYDDVLRLAMLAETRHFVTHLIKEDLGIANLVDSNFTFLNRRLGEHYGIDGIEGEQMRLVELPTDSVRGGLLSHASIAKVTANGTVTSPVKRGSFVLTNLLGLPPNPPPPGVGAIEPDTRGATTIRETLMLHQQVESCASCHRHIDPAGFALEGFDPVGNYREQYRNSRGVRRTSPPGLRFAHVDYDLGLPVDTSGQTATGEAFDDVRDFRRLMRNSSEQIARNVVHQLVAFSTGCEVEFADRDQVERILDATRDEGYPLRSLIQQVVASPMFRNR